MPTIRTLYPLHCTGEALSHIPMSLTRHLNGGGLDVDLWVPSCEGAGDAAFVRQGATGLTKKLLYKLEAVTHKPLTQRYLERRYLAAFGDGDAAYLWPSRSVEIFGRVKERGIPLFVERINTLDRSARVILDEAYARAGWPIGHHINDAIVASEQVQVEAADFIFSPSPPVTESLLAGGVPAGKILATSYGWDPARFAGDDRTLPPAAGVTFLFVGSVCVRKGAHLLLEAWSKAGVRGRLVLAGKLDDEIARYCAAHLSRPDVVHLPFNPKLGPVYRSADAFVFPTLEEGSPLVSYEALGNGLPVITSPMGAGEVVRDGIEGLVVGPYEEERLIDAVRKLAGDMELRREMGTAGRKRAGDFTWEKVAARRRGLILEALGRADEKRSRDVEAAVA